MTRDYRQGGRFGLRHIRRFCPDPVGRRETPQGALPRDPASHSRYRRSGSVRLCHGHVPLRKRHRSIFSPSIPPSFCLDVRFGLSKLTSQLGKDEIAGVFLFARNFTDAWLLGLTSQRFSLQGARCCRVFRSAGKIRKPLSTTCFRQ